MLIHFGVKPYVVFDGGYLPSKEHTEKDRAARRRESKRLGLELLRMDRPSQAYLELQKAIDVTPKMARELIEELKRMNVPYVVAPYEADSQLAYLENHGLISGVLSEDSDLLVFGVKCLLTKLDQYGECVMINRADFTACREVSLVGWTDHEFRIMAMLSGCDYLPGIDKMGLKTAYRLVRKHKGVDRIIRSVQFDGKMKVPAGYLDAFARAEKTFLYQWVFCPKAKCLVNLNKLPTGLDATKMPYIGRKVDAKIAIGVATGELDPNTKERLVVSHLSRDLQTSWNTARQTPDEKQGKPISEFFKPKRTPLAELDPNSFTPSPSQQRLLENQQGASWSASQIPGSRLPALPEVSSSNRRSTAPAVSRQDTSRGWPDRLRASPKRQRLCSEKALAASTDGAIGLENATSRFFSKQTVQPSPSLRKASSKKDDFELWSDDSAAEAVAVMTATQEAAADQKTPSSKKRKKLEVFQDPDMSLFEPETSAQSPVEEGDTTQDTVAITFSDNSPNDVWDETPDTSFEDLEPEVSSTVFSKGVATNFEDFKSRFGFQSKRVSQGIARTISLPQPPRDHVAEAKRKKLLGRLSAHSRTDAQDQHLRPSGNELKDEIPPIIPASSPIAAPGLDEENADIIDDKDWLELEQHQVASKDPQVLQGSEDLLVPNSPESPGESTNRRQLNLGRFTFAG